MRKFTFSFKSLLVAAGLLLGSANAWGQTVTWNMDAQGTYTGGKELSSNTSIVSVKLGSGTWSYDATWGVCGSPKNEQPTLTDNVPTSGNYIVIKPTVDITMSLDTRSSANHNFVLIEESNPTTEIINVRARYYITYELGTLSKSLKAGKTYYAYSKGGADLGYRAFTVKTIEEYSIHYVDNSATPVTIKTDVVHEGVYGTSVSASGSDLDAIVYNEKTYAYYSGNTPITLTTGTNEITLVYKLAGEHNYTVNAVAGSSTLKELATGSTVESMEYSVSNLPLVIEKDGNYYALTDAGVSGYTKTFTMGTSDEVKTVEYTLDESIAYFAEGEVLYSAQLTASADCSNGAYTYYLSGLTSTFPLSAGWYRMETVVKDRANKNPLNIYLEDGTELATIAKGGSTGFRKTDLFKLDATSNVKIGLTDPSNKNSLSFDYVLVRRLPAPEGKFYLKNKANGGYLGAGLNYGTKAITSSIGHTVTLSYSAGKYTIDTSISNGGDYHYLNGAWCDGAAYGWTFISDGAGYYTVSDGTNNLTAGAVGAEITLTSGTGDNAKWQLLTEAEWKAEQVARLDAATSSNGVDATFYIPAANFNRNDNTENAKWQGSPTIGGLSENSANTNFNAQKYNTSSFDVYQALTGLKPGAYKLTMQGFYRNGDAADADASVRNAILYANSTELALVNVVSEGKAEADADHGFTTLKSGKYVPNTQTDASKAFNAGNYVNELFVVVGEDGALRVGVKKTTAVTKDWTVFDNFQLTYYGNTVPASISEYGWATFSSDYPLDFTGISDFEAYMITGHEGNVVTKSKVEGTVPASTGLLLKGDKGDYNIPVVASSSTDVSANKLVAGTGAEVSEGGDNTRYVLGVNNNGTAGDESDDFAEFQKIGGTAATVAKGKAYLEFVGVSLVKVFNIVDGAATGVEAPVAAEAAVEDGVYYNLNGQQVTKDYKGIVIVNGKKFYNK